MAKEKIFITGGCGFIGSHLVQFLHGSGDEVMVYDSCRSYAAPLVNRSYPLALEKRYEMVRGKAAIVEGDIRDVSYLKSVVSDFKPDKIVHLAALPIADKSNRFPQEAVSVNYNGTVNVLDAARGVAAGLKKFVNISSSMVYGDFQRSPCDEAHPLNPRDVYGATKSGAESIVKVYAFQYDFPYVIIRPSAVYGPTDSNHRVSQLFVDRALSGEPLILHNGGKSKLDFTFVEDTARGIFLATKNDGVVNETFNITRGEGRSLAELAAIVKKHLPNAVIEYREPPKGDKRPERGAMDISKARELLGYEPKFSLEEGMARYIDFVQSMGL